jgi:diaminopimelate decarboxylase
MELAAQLAAEGHTIRFLDAGGGLGISYDSSKAVDYPSLVAQYAEAITTPLQKMRKPRPHLLLEPGRSIIGQAGALITRVLYQKRNGNKHFTIVDAAMNDLIRPSLYGARHEIVPVSLDSGRASAGASAPALQTDVCGPICETGDFLARDAALPAVSEGSLLCVYDAGAYGMALASNYNTRPRAAEVLVDGVRTKLVRRRESLNDMLRPEADCL